MNMLYDSDNFVVIHVMTNAPEDGELITELPRHGFEIVRKESNTEVFLDGSIAKAFQAQLQAWQQTTPSQEEVEEYLDAYTQLATVPLLMH